MLFFQLRPNPIVATVVAFIGLAMMVNTNYHPVAVVVGAILMVIALVQGIAWIVLLAIFIWTYVQIALLPFVWLARGVRRLIRP